MNRHICLAIVILGSLVQAATAGTLEELAELQCTATMKMPAGNYPEKLKILLFSGRNNHDWKTTTPFLKEIYEKSGRFTVDITDDPVSFADKLSGYDVIVSNWASFPKMNERMWGEKMEKAFLDFVREGKGFALFHAAGAGFHTWPEFHQLIGSTWGNTTGHGKQHSFEVKCDPNHPITQGMKPFITFDELWHRTQKHPDQQTIGTAFSAKENGGSDAEESVVLVTKLGNGRGFNLVLGHDTLAMGVLGWQALMLRGTEWAAINKVTIPLPPELAAATVAPSEPGLNWVKGPDTLALANDGKVVWQLNTKPSEDKPYFHPLATSDGSVLTWLRPADHVHHRSLWFSWKYINGVNYWEEDRKTGLSRGRTEITNVSQQTSNDHSAQVVIDLSYHPPENPALLTEKRTMLISAPDKQGNYTIDWNSVFTAVEDVKLGRTPISGEPGGRAGGGYAGLSLRMAKETRGWNFLNSEGLADVKGHAHAARWVDFYGKTTSGKPAGVAVFDHPSNLRYPTPWYVKPDMPYYSPALLLKEPLELKKGDILKLTYRVLVHNGHLSPEELNARSAEFTK